MKNILDQIGDLLLLILSAAIIYGGVREIIYIVME